MNQVVDQSNNESLLDPFAGEFAYRFNIPVICHSLIEPPGLLDIQKNDFNNRILLEVLSSHSLSK